MTRVSKDVSNAVDHATAEHTTGAFVPARLRTAGRQFSFGFAALRGVAVVLTAWDGVPVVRAMGNAWFGSKAASGLCQALIALMPPQAVYIETHLGGGAVMRRKPVARSALGFAYWANHLF